MLPDSRNWLFEPPSSDNVGAPPVVTELANVHTLVAAVPFPATPPSRSTNSTGLSTALLNVIVIDWPVPNGDGSMKSAGAPLTAAP